MRLSVEVSKENTLVFYAIKKGLSTREYTIIINNNTNEIMEADVIEFGSWDDISKERAIETLNEIPNLEKELLLHKSPINLKGVW